MKIQNPLVWFEIYADDLQRANSFYKEVFNIKLDVLPTPGGLEEERSMLAFPMEMNGPGTGGALINAKDFKA